MGSVGKNPHRPEGKTTDAERMQSVAMNAGPAHDASHNDKARHRQDRETMERMREPTSFPAEEQVGGSRPGVESRVKEAIERREAREEDEA